ncbi:MAG: hypothetical protein JSU87_01495 [Gemmatimonadota bacterium]|nr:MAG: hypothetical protein JSU87_01495 [Gemmatimonadota bacterium]
MPESPERLVKLKVLVPGLLVAAALLAAPAPVQAQEGSTAASLGGAALGLYSGALLGLSGSTLACSQVAGPRSCARLALAGGGAIGGIAGGLLGDADSREIEDAYRAAGYGALAGAAVGVLVKELVYYYDWVDVLAFTALGGAIGPVAPAAGLGLAAGAAVGFGLRLVVPSFELTDVAALGGIGLALGGLTAWALEAADARGNSDGDGPSVTIDLLNISF